MRSIKYIVIHCTATKPSATVEAIRRFWEQERGWRNPGYHYLIGKGGVIHELLDEDDIANGAIGYNFQSIHVGYIGGLDSNGNPKDTRTKDIETSMHRLILKLSRKYPSAVILGHRDLPGVAKECPCFDVQKWLESKDIELQEFVNWAKEERNKFIKNESNSVDIVEAFNKLIDRVIEYGKIYM